MEEKKTVKPAHNVIVESRKKMSISAVEEVSSFSDTGVTLTTSLGVLTVKGAGLHVNRLSIETGDVDIDGKIDSVSYSASTEKNPTAGLFGKLFK